MKAMLARIAKGKFLVIPGIIVAYLLTRFAGLTALPIFADEAIYIRWAQLIRHEPLRYAFFSLNDGKPPLYIWTLLPALLLNTDPLWAARAVSVGIGLLQLGLSDWLVRHFRGGPFARLASAVIILIAPFWYFHQRMALLDGLLTLFLTATFAGLSLIHSRQFRRGCLLAGTSWGLALWTKTPALFFAPVFVVMAVAGPWLVAGQSWPETLNPKVLVKRIVWFALAGLLGLLIFALLRVAPAFGSLLGRSEDFTFTLGEILGGNWRTSIDNLGRLINWLGAYLRPELLSLAAIALLLSKQKKTHLLFWLSALIFAFPLLVLGKTLHPRYFLPLAPLLTLSGALFFAEARDLVRRAKDSLFLTLFVVLIAFFLAGSLRFLLLAIFTPNQIPFVPDDRVQYLTEWSSGHGIREVRDLLLIRSREGKRTTVVTEGSFGSLPDGLLLYFDQAPEIANLRIEGLAQYPVKFLPDWVKQEAGDHETWLVVNEHRMEVPLSEVELLYRFPRPYGAPELQVYRVKADL